MMETQRMPSVPLDERACAGLKVEPGGKPMGWPPICGVQPVFFQAGLRAFADVGGMEPLGRSRID